MKMAAHNYYLLSSTGMYGLAKNYDMSDRRRKLKSIDIPQNTFETKEVTSENAAGREHVPVVIGGKEDVTVEMDFIPPRRGGGVSDFLCFFPPCYNGQSAATVDEALFKNRYVWAFNAIGSKVGGGKLESGSTEMVNSTAVLTINGAHSVHPTFDCATGLSTLQEGEQSPVLAADGTAPTVPATNDDVTATAALTMYAIATGFYNFIDGALASDDAGNGVAVNAGDKIVYDSGVWTVTSGSW